MLHDFDSAVYQDNALYRDNEMQQRKDKNQFFTIKFLEKLMNKTIMTS